MFTFAARYGDGIIPALAGNTPRRTGITCTHTDHPRSRGEYFVDSPDSLLEDGSSPLSRGILGSHGPRVDGVGIIPALAGNTRRAVADGFREPDHPRSRGEYAFDGDFILSRLGSSPLSRGIPESGRHQRQHRRIIPALAGNTWQVFGNNSCSQDHPRSRGEYVRVRITRERTRGSSPLSRGIPRPEEGPPIMTGIIPALAGNTEHLLPRLPSTMDHPRSRGEYSQSLNRFAYVCGSSPLSRGILSGSPHPCPRTRIIPALAGNTLCQRSGGAQ